MKRRAEIGAFALVFLVAAYIHHPVEYDNTRSRYLLVSAVVDRGRLDIGEPGTGVHRSDTIDTAVSGDRVYSNKAIGVPLLAVPVYWALRRWTPVEHDPPLSLRARYVCRLFTTSLPFAAAGVAMYGLLLGLGAGKRAAFASVVMYSLGTIAWIHGSMFAGHQTAASLAFLSFAILWNAVQPGGRRAGLKTFIAGVFAGVAALSDYTAGFIALALLGYALAKSRSVKLGLAFAAGSAVEVALLAAYNEHCFDNPFALSYASLDHAEFAAGAARGFFGVALPDPAALLSLWITPSRGVFFLMPLLLMAIPGWWSLSRHRRPSQQRILRAEAFLVAVIVCGYFAINAGFYAWHGGWTFGPRYLTPMLPFFALPIAFAFDGIWAAILFAFAVVQIGFAQVVMPHTPEAIQNPIVECFGPLYRYGYTSQNVGAWLGIPGLWSLAPLAAGIALLYWWALPAREADATKSTTHSRAAWRWVYAAACVGIAAGLFSVHTKWQSTVHSTNYRLLEGAAAELDSRPLRDAALRERQLSMEIRQ